MNEHDNQERSSAPLQCEGCGTTREDRHAADCLIDCAQKQGITPEELQAFRDRDKNALRKAAGVPPISTVIDDVMPLPGGMVVGPDDVLVVTLPADTDLDVLDAFMKGLKKKLGGRVVVICGAEEIAVVKQ